ncbi:phage minor structural protein, N-terminal domain protein [Streptococcus infantis SK1076]|uniref:Phage minor structural protein, N-terminal domain protein n=1 Tax=Streptococcus infantis SK1076 TaxID=1005705 RepID=F5W038_9STRE|nr:phage tail spike protein [Streptococcus infantis]EGL86913.1 phage minor structural protein, N-terminal domain protein [Streptococcus infantis SK1076]
MLYLLDKDVRTVRWNGEPLHEATSAIVKETMNGDFTLTVKYPISDSEIYQLIQEDMLIKAPTPVLGAQLFRIKTPVEHNDYLEITAYHISDDIMQRSITPLSVSSQSCDMALSRMVQNTKTALGDFSFNSDIQERRTFNTTETETLYSVLLDGKHSIVGTWEGELVRDNFAMTVKKNRGENRGVVITTHKNLKDYQRTRNSQNVVTRIHAKSTFKPEGAETETTLKVTVDSPLINSYPYINEKEYENNNAKTVEELKKWAQAKFTNQGIDKVSDAIKIEAYELDGQVVHMGDTVNIKSRKHNVDAFKKAIAYEFDALKEEYISLTFDDKAGTGGSRSSGGLSNAADAIIGVTESAQEIALEKAIQNADLAFDHQAGLLRQEILDGVELAKAKAEENKRALSDEIDRRFHEFSPEGFDEAKAKAEEALKKAGASEDLAKEAKLIANNGIQSLNEVRDIATNNIVYLADYKEQVNGRFANLSSQVAGKVNDVDFQRVKETAQLYERILGSSESDISKNASRLVMSSEIFQTEVGKYVTDDNNLIVNSLTMSTNTLVNASRQGVEVFVNDGVFTIKAQGLTSYNFSGFTLPIYVKKIYHGEIYTLGFKYRIREYPDSTFVFNLKNHGLNKTLLSSDIGKNRPPIDEWQEFQKTFTMQEDFVFGEDKNYPFYIFLAKNGWIEFKEPILVRGSKTGPYKPSQFDDAYKTTDEAKGLATDAQTRAIQIAQGLEATRTQVTQLAGSYAIQNLNSAGDIINGINFAANGSNRIIGKATHITGDTLIDNAVIKSAMIDKLKTANFEAGSVTTTILGAEAVTAEKVKFDAAFIQKLVSQQAFIDELFAKQATITRIQSIDFTGNNIKGGKISSLNGVTDFDLQTGWIEMNKEAVGIRNRFPDRPTQFLIFGKGILNGVPGAYTQLMSNRNGVTGIEHTSAGIQIWNGREGSNVQTAITFYGKSMDFMPNSQGGGIQINAETRDIIIRGHSLVQLFDYIDKNFAGIEAHFKRNKLGSPGRYGIRI